MDRDSHDDLIDDNGSVIGVKATQNNTDINIKAIKALFLLLEDLKKIKV